VSSEKIFVSVTAGFTLKVPGSRVKENIALPPSAVKKQDGD